MNVEFVHDLLPVLFDCFDADFQLGSNLFVRKTFSDQLQDFGLA